MTSSQSEYNADHYVQRLDLGDDPFASDVDTGYRYSTPERREQLDQLVHFGRFSSQLVMLVGATGSGTSTLLDQSILQLREVMDCCYLNAEVVSEPRQLLESICEQFQFNFEYPVTPGDFLVSLQDSFSADPDMEPVLIAVDQAHFLSLESFELLRSILAAEVNLHVILAGEYQIEQLATLARFERDHIKQLELLPLNQSETGEFVLGLLRSVGYAHELPFNSDQLAVLHEQSAGNIAEIKQLAPALLAAPENPRKSTFNFGIPVAHVAAIAILAAILLVSWIYQGEQTASTSALPEPSIAAVDQAEPLRSIEPKVGSDIAKDITVGAINRKPIAVDTDTKVVTEASPGAVIAADTSLSKVELGRVDSADSRQDAPNQDAPSKAVQAVNDLGAKKAAPDAPLTVAVEPPAKKPAQVVVATKTKPQAVEVMKPVPSDTAERSLSIAEQRLLNMAESVYVLQLLGAVDEQRTQRFVKRYTGRLPVSYFQTSRNGKPWYVVVAGPYSNRAEAQEKLKGLPPELKKQRPWIRSLASVQKDIRAKQL